MSLNAPFSFSRHITKWKHYQENGAIEFFDPHKKVFKYYTLIHITHLCFIEVRVFCTTRIFVDSNPQNIFSELDNWGKTELSVNKMFKEIKPRPWARDFPDNLKVGYLCLIFTFFICWRNDQLFKSYYK